VNLVTDKSLRLLFLTSSLCMLAILLIITIIILLYLLLAVQPTFHHQSQVWQGEEIRVYEICFGGKALPSTPKTIGIIKCCFHCPSFITHFTSSSWFYISNSCLDLGILLSTLISDIMLIMKQAV